VTWPEFSSLHPFAPAKQNAGTRELIDQLSDWLVKITGYDAVSLQPNAGSQGEFAGLLAIRNYHDSRGDQGRTICLIPSSAHGTNAASAVMAGMQVVVIECDEHGNEIISIMFEMKNENDDTDRKRKNEDFFKKLDKDRTDKGCEYAVLVSMLETDSELYNTGIVDVSYKYPRMYVVRPQFFIPIITLLRNAAMSSLQYKTELALVKSQQIDITNFETELDLFKTAFARNYDLASRHFQTAVEEIDKSILHLQRTKDALLTTSNNLRLANNKSQDVTVRRLTRDNPTMAAKFEALKEQNQLGSDQH
jgi:hypothetical protein